MKTTYFNFKRPAPFITGILALFIVTFIFLSFYVIAKPPQYLDIHISKEIQENQSFRLNNFMTWASWFGQISISVIITVSISLLFFFLKYKRESILLLSTLSSGLVGLFFKILINRPRPSKEFVTLLENTEYQSFPSGHVLFYTVFFGSLIFIIIKKVQNKRIRNILIGFCLSVILIGSVSRIYLGSHWFTDVLGGFVLGVILLFIVAYFYFRVPTTATNK